MHINVSVYQQSHEAVAQPLTGGISGDRNTRDKSDGIGYLNQMALRSEAEAEPATPLGIPSRGALRSLGCGETEARQTTC